MKKIYALLALGLGMATQAQEQPATLEYGSGSLPKETTAMFKFDDVPVSLYTGVPDVSIPLLSLPTRSKEISIDMSYRYHPSGSGWNISYGGTITRVIESSSFEFRDNEYGYTNNLRLTKDIYKFSFMGHSGSFTTLARPDGSMSILANKGQYIRIEAHPGPIPGLIDSFTAYDTKGYRFEFGVYDKNILIPSGIGSQKESRTSYRLTAIYDNNGQKLAGITYTEKFNQDPGSNKKEYRNITASVDSEGFGKAQFVYNTTGWSGIINEITLLDPNSNVVKRVDFREMGKLVFRDPAQNKNEEYRFHYSDGVYGNYNAERGLHRTDRFGYPNFIPYDLYEEGYMAEVPYIMYSVNPNIVTSGVLEKISLPTGGSILYEYESNTYSFFSGQSISKTIYSGGAYIEDPDYYYNYTPHEDTFAYNHIVEIIKKSPMGMLSFFDVDGVGQQTIHISIKPELYFSQLSLTWVYPQVNVNGPGQNFPHYRPYNMENYGYGKGFPMNPGRYGIQVGNFTEPGNGASYTISRIRRNPDVKKWKYGGGRRIKRIAYFDTDVPANLFRQDYSSEGYKPAKETRYSYNLFDEPNRSSGNLVADSYMSFSDKYGQVEFVGYRNVTVTESGNNGKTEYIFSSSADYPFGTIDIEDTASQSIDYKRGLLKNKKSYDSNGNVVQNTSYDYVFFGESNQISYLENRTVRDRVGRSRIQSETTTYYPANSEPVVKSTQYAYYDDINRSLESKTTATSAGENLKTKYYYHVGNSSLSKNRISEVEKTEEYRNGILTSTNKTNYSNVWPGNMSWLLQTVQSSKGAGTLETKVRFNIYDGYGNPLEIQQENGMKTALIWGYNNTKVIARIDNIAQSSIPFSLVTAVKNASDANPYIEANMLTALKNLRKDSAMSKTLMTTYTYRPLIGVSTVTDPTGSTTRYEYDSFGRIKAVYDSNGNILSENDYLYRTQN